MTAANRDFIATIEKYRANPNAPCPNAVGVTPDNSNDLEYVPRCLYIGVGGDVAVKVLDADGAAQSRTFKNVPSGSILPICPSRVLATGTTATDILALW